MHDDPRQGVVDRDCRVHGIDNLYIAGSSVFPTAGSGTPTHDDHCPRAAPRRPPEGAGGVTLRPRRSSSAGSGRGIPGRVGARAKDRRPSRLTSFGARRPPRIRSRATIGRATGGPSSRRASCRSDPALPAVTTSSSSRTSSSPAHGATMPIASRSNGAASSRTRASGTRVPSNTTARWCGRCAARHRAAGHAAPLHQSGLVHPRRRLVETRAAPRGSPATSSGSRPNSRTRCAGGSRSTSPRSTPRTASARQLAALSPLRLVGVWPGAAEHGARPPSRL